LRAVTRAAAHRGRRNRAVEFFGLTPEIVAVSTSMFLLGCGENLWRRFLPKYLQALGAPITAIGAFGTAEDFLDGVYQYPGGWAADRYGRRFALILFISLAALGYLLYWRLPSWQLAFAALALIMAWDSMASPTLFAVVGDALPPTKRAMGFTVQSILRRIPIVIAPTIGGFAVAAYGIQGGVRLGLVVSMAMAAITILVVSRLRIPVIPDRESVTVLHVWQSFPSALRWLLVSDVFIRACDALVDVFLVIYALNVMKISAPSFGTLIAMQAMTTIVVQVPAAHLAARAGKKPFVTATFIAFALFPLAVVLAPSFVWMVVAFVVGGLREVGEPARKALIVDFAAAAMRGRVVGLYYLCRSVAIAPAAFIGGLLWRVNPALPFYVATAIGFVGVAAFVATVKE
jgi:MFS family permease